MGPTTWETTTQTTRTLDDRYELLELAGVGGASEVWRARDRRLGRDVAVKVLSGPAARDPVHRRRIEREARALAALSHPNVVGVYDYGEEPQDAGEPVPYIVMELIDGPDLSKRLRANGPMEPSEAAGVVAGILAGIEQAHRIGIVHGDLKPANVLLTPSGPKVADFGVARILSEETGATRVAATPTYAPPEVLNGERPTPASDVYSASCIAYEALAGRPPYPGTTVFELARQHLEDPIPSVRRDRSDVPEELDEAVRRGLAKDPAHRPSADELSHLLSAPVARPRLDPGADPTSTVAVLRQPTETLPPRPRRGEKAAAAAAGLRGHGIRLARRIPAGLVLAALTILALLALRQGATATTKVPDLRGMQASAASTLAASYGFKVAPHTVDVGGKAGTVVGQVPAPSSLLEKGQTITLDVSKGAPQATVPDLRGTPVDDARRALRSAKLVPGDVSYQPTGDADPGTVLRTEPPAGTSVDQGSTVHIVAAAFPIENRRRRGGGDD